jgi:hypothetical protein
MVFLQSDSTMTVTIAMREDHWGMPVDSLEGTAQYIVQSRGKGLYTLYNNEPTEKVAPFRTGLHKLTLI